MRGRAKTEPSVPDRAFADFQTRFEERGARVLVQMVVGRSGSLLLQSLLDGHPEILMFPGVLRFYQFFPRGAEKPFGEWEPTLRRCLDDWYDSARLVHNSTERLGLDGAQRLEIDVSALVESVRNLAGQQGQQTSRRSLFLALHYALATALGKNLREVRAIYLHEHAQHLTPEIVDEIRSDFPSAHFLCTVRDPRSNYLSIRKLLASDQVIPAWDEGWKFAPYVTFQCWRRYAETLAVVQRCAEHFTLIRLEDLRSVGTGFIGSFTGRTGISPSAEMRQTTFGGKLWNGDIFSFSGPGFRDQSKTGKGPEEIHPIKGAAIELLLKDEMTAMGYTRTHASRLFIRALALLLVPLWPWDDLRLLLGLNHVRYLKRRRRPVLREMAKWISWYFATEWRILKLIFGRSRMNYSKVPSTVLRFEGATRPLG